MPTTALALLPFAFLAATAASETAPATDAPLVQEWKVEYGGRPRDPYVGPDGKVWFVGQAGNYVASFDPHTMAFDGRGHIWFTSQAANRVGRLDMKTGEVRLVTPNDSPGRPYGLVIDAKGYPWVSLLNTDRIVRVDPETFAVTQFKKATPDSRSRRIEVTTDGSVWYGDEPRGFLGRINPETGEVKEYALPGGAGSKPYALTQDGDGRLWVSQTGPDKKLVAFDPKAEKFVAALDVSDVIRHMRYDAKTDAMWFGTDANRIGRVITRQAVR